jgi:hypothetical protein
MLMRLQEAGLIFQEIKLYVSQLSLRDVHSG